MALATRRIISDILPSCVPTDSIAQAAGVYELLNVLTSGVGPVVLMVIGAVQPHLLNSA